jgi:hypothetical protein
MAVPNLTNTNKITPTNSAKAARIKVESIVAKGKNEGPDGMHWEQVNQIDLKDTVFCLVS